jgi:hypothetical protein
MPGGCCLLGVCCPPKLHGRRIDALAAEINTALAEGGGVDDGARVNRVAELILSRYDLVPKGLGDAIVEAYRPIFAEERRGGSGAAEE